MAPFSSSPPPPFLPPDVQFHKEHVSQQIKIEGALLAIYLLYIIILILGRLRSRGNNFMKQFSTKSFMITGQFIAYIPGLMNTPNAPNDLYLFWAAFIAYLAAVTNEISCFTLEDNEDHKKRLVFQYAVVWPFIISSLYYSLAAPEIIVPVVLIFWISIYKLRQRRRALVYATKSSNGFALATQIVSDFVEYEKGREPRVEVEHSTSNYSKFLVGVREAQKVAAKHSKMKSKTKSTSKDTFPPNADFVTLHKIMHTNDPFFMSTNPVGDEIQQTCFSFAMFSTLLAKMAGFDNVDAVIFKGNKELPKNPFALIEKELDFFYRYLFTNYYAIYVGGFRRKFRDLGVIFLFLLVTVPLFVQYQPQDHNLVYVSVWGGHVLDTGFTRCVIISIFIIECCQTVAFLTSKWAKVMYTCAYFENETRGRAQKYFKWLIKLAFLIPRPKLSLFCLNTDRKMGQYSITESFGAIPTLLWVQCLLRSYFDLPKVGQAGNFYIKVEPQLKNSMLGAIRASFDSDYGGKFSNGVFSLERNGVRDDIICDYVKNSTSQARVILIWHIATCFLEKDAKESSPSIQGDNYFATATKISKYCAYLVVFVPKIVPNLLYTTECEFDQAVKELENEKLLREEAKENETEKLNNAEEEEDLEDGSNQNQSILREARKLKEKLENKRDLWRILAEFWTEMLLFLALSDHPQAMEAHADKLCTGGEFITHLWALVTHAGCSKTSVTQVHAFSS